jgi:hypothetical protein
MHALSCADAQRTSAWLAAKSATEICCNLESLHVVAVKQQGKSTSPSISINICARTSRLKKGAIGRNVPQVPGQSRSQHHSPSSVGVFNNWLSKQPLIAHGNATPHKHNQSLFTRLCLSACDTSSDIPVPPSIPTITMCCQAMTALEHAE